MIHDETASALRRFLPRAPWFSGEYAAVGLDPDGAALAALRNTVLTVISLPKTRRGARGDVDLLPAGSAAERPRPCRQDAVRRGLRDRSRAGGGGERHRVFLARWQTGRSAASASASRRGHVPATHRLCRRTPADHVAEPVAAGAHLATGRRCPAAIRRRSGETGRGGIGSARAGQSAAGAGR